MPHLLVQDLRSPSLPPPTCTALQRELARLADDTSPEPRPKRVKLDPNSPTFSAIPLHTRVCVCNAVRAVVDGQPVQPPFWKLFSHSELDSNLYHFLFHVSECTVCVEKQIHINNFTLYFYTNVFAFQCENFTY